MGIGFNLTTEVARGIAAPRKRSIDTMPIAASLVPDYLSSTPTYRFAYLQSFAPYIFDHQLVVSAILWGNAGRLTRAVLEELHEGQRVLQAACVYGDFSTRVGRFLGPEGELDVIDIVPLQVANSRRKLRNFSHVTVRLGDVAAPVGQTYDAVCCFFLLHELPDAYKRRVVDNLLDSVRPGGKVIFVDFHRPHPAYSVKSIVGLIHRYLEPFAHRLWERDIRSFASETKGFTWRTCAYFGGQFQKTVAHRLESDHATDHDSREQASNIRAAIPR